jgi:flavodoxin
MSTLIVCYSFSGNNRMLARFLRTRLGADLQEIEEVKPRTGFAILLDILFKRSPQIKKASIRWSQYDQVLFLAPIWNHRIASPLRAFLEQEKEHIGPYGFITLCGTGGNHKITAELTQLVGHPPEAVLELLVNDLLPPEKKNKIRYTSGYKVGQEELAFFEPALEKFLRQALAV